MSDIHFLSDMLHRNHIYLGKAIQEKMLHYLYMMQRWNRISNLTSITEIHKMIVLHLLDSLSIYPFLQGNRILDVGTGAGLPSIPLALMDEKRSFTLLDSNHKKIRFLTQVKLELQLNHVELVNMRVENFHPDKTFDSILSRGFASLKEMLLATQHLISETGQFLAMKGIYPEQEVSEVPHPFRLVSVHPLKIQGLDAKRHLLLFDKEHSWVKQ